MSKNLSHHPEPHHSEAQDPARRGRSSADRGSDRHSVRGRVLLFCLEHLCHDLRHDWNGPFNSTGLNLGLIQRVLVPDAAPDLRARAVDWAEAIGQEMQAFHRGLQHFFDLLSASGEGSVTAVDSQRLWPRIETLIAPTARRRQSTFSAEVDGSAAVRASEPVPLLAAVAVSLLALKPEQRLVWRMPSEVQTARVCWRLDCTLPMDRSPDLDAVEEMMKAEGGRGTLSETRGQYEMCWPRDVEPADV